MRQFKEFNTKPNAKRNKSCSNYQFPNVKSILKRRSQPNQSLFKNEFSKTKKKNFKNNHLGKDDLYFNANLNIINILNTCVTKDSYNESFFPNMQKDNFKDNIYKKKKPKRKSQENSNMNKLTPNIYLKKSRLDFNNKKYNFNTSIETNPINHSKKETSKRLSRKEILSNTRSEKSTTVFH